MPLVLRDPQGVFSAEVFSAESLTSVNLRQTQQNERRSIRIANKLEQLTNENSIVGAVPDLTKNLQGA